MSTGTKDDHDRDHDEEHEHDEHEEEEDDAHLSARLLRTSVSLSHARFVAARPWWPFTLCEAVFAPSLAGLSSADRARRLAQLVAVCDVYTWMLLRRRSGLSRDQTELALRELLKPLTGRGH